jgi:alpha-tubulin suppressor-like RCC1 family protein
MCAVRDDGTAACWEGSYGAQPSWAEGALTAPPVTEVSGVADIVQLAILAPNTVFTRDPAEAHRLTLCVLDARGVVHCRGNNFLGELGDATTVSRDGFAPVRALPAIVRLSANNRRVCAQSADGRLFCWGESYFRTPAEQAAANPERCVIRDDGSSLPCSTTPREASGLRGVLDHMQGGGFTCAYQDDARTRCMGFNVFGQLGDRTREFREAFTPVQF